MADKTPGQLPPPQDAHRPRAIDELPTVELSALPTTTRAANSLHASDCSEARAPKPWSRRARILVSVLLLLLLVGGGALGYALLLYERPICENPIQNFIHPVARGSG